MYILGTIFTLDGTVETSLNIKKILKWNKSEKIRSKNNKKYVLWNMVFYPIAEFTSA